MKASLLRRFLILSSGGIAAAASAQPAQPPEAAPGEDEIVVEGTIPVCMPRPGDPLDKVRVKLPDYKRQMVIKADEKGVYRLARDDDPITGPDLWQRAGTAIEDYVFRVPTDGYALCIGARKKQRNGWGQLRRVLDAKPLVGKYARFTAYVTRTRAEEVRFWLAVGNRVRVIQGGDTRVDPLAGSGDWARVAITIGPIPPKAIKLSYGFLLYGRGDVWVDEPKLDILDEPPPRSAGALPLVPVRGRVVP